VDWGLSRNVFDLAALTEAVTHHALGKQKKHDHHGNYKQEPYNVEPRWLSPCGSRRIQIICHQSYVSSVGSTTPAAP
jgi:hypothetical protein